jgi:L-asparaginase/beta-aspartyl-peptidase (threonine type)
LSDRFCILIHGGIVTTPERVTDAHIELMRSIVAAARVDLAAGRAAVDVVVDAIVGMEDSGLLNAGKGSLATTAGIIETDASLMDGATGQVGAVAVMRAIRNPIRAARIVMERTPHVFLAGPAGEAALKALGADTVEDPSRYFTRSRHAVPAGVKSGTVGAVALDCDGRLAAGTSTGGYPGKLPGRVSDSSIVGASTYADDNVALSATGRGEDFIRRSATVDIARRAEYLGLPLKAAADTVVHGLLGDIDKADAAVIAIDTEGEIVLSVANAYGVLHGFATDSHATQVGVQC